MMKLESILRQYLAVGTNVKNDPEKNQRILVANLFGLIGYSITFIMGVAAVLRQDYVLSTILLVASATFFSPRLILTQTRIPRPERISGTIVTLALMLLVTYLVYSGGVHNTGPLWMYIVPPVALFFGGMRQGSRNLGLFVILISVILFYPNDVLLTAHYTFEFKSRLIYSFLTVSLLFAFYEYSRQKLYRLSQEISQKYENQARLDLLSNLLNRRGMTEVLETEFSRCKRHNLELSIIMCDVDHFKLINDKYGHQMGDNVIANIATLFHSELRQHDSVSRWGGEEYLFLLPETNAKQAYLLAEKLRQSVEEQRFDSENNILKISVSMGVYQVNFNDSINHAISLADKALYQAKESGRNRTVIYHSPL